MTVLLQGKQDQKKKGMRPKSKHAGETRVVCDRTRNKEQQADEDLFDCSFYSTPRNKVRGKGEGSQ